MRLRFPRWTRWALYVVATPRQPAHQSGVGVVTVLGITRYGIAFAMGQTAYSCGIEHSPVFVGGVWTLPRKEAV